MIYSGFALGFLAMGMIVFVAMPKMMFVNKKSRYNLSDTVEKLEESIIRHKWGHRGTWFIHNDLNQANIDFQPRIVNVTLCKAPYAAEILSDEKSRFAAALMPCAFTVWEKDNGQVYVTKMNTGLMGPMFGGAIARIMGGKVSQEERDMLKDIVY